MSQPAGFLCPPPGNAPTDSHLILWEKMKRSSHIEPCYSIPYTQCVCVCASDLINFSILAGLFMIKLLNRITVTERERESGCVPLQHHCIQCVSVRVGACVYLPCHRICHPFPKLIKPSLNPAVCKTHTLTAHTLELMSP